MVVDLYEKYKLLILNEHTDPEMTRKVREQYEYDQRELTRDEKLVKSFAAAENTRRNAGSYYRSLFWLALLGFLLWPTIMEGNDKPGMLDDDSGKASGPQGLALTSILINFSHPPL